MIAGYVGRSDTLDRALARFARAYADQTEADHAMLVAAVRRGVFPVAETSHGVSTSAFRP
jgi:Leu/Phe-tRNA-protein transferase